MCNAEELNNLKGMFCPPLEPSLVERVYKQSDNFNDAVNELLSINEEPDLVPGPSSLGLPSSGSEESVSTFSTTDESSAIEFLKVCFPNEDENELNNILLDCNNDIESAVECCLSLGVIQKANNEVVTVKIIRDKKDQIKEVDEKYRIKNKKKNKNKNKNKEVNLNLNYIEKWTTKEYQKFQEKYAVLLNLYPNLPSMKIIEQMCVSQFDSNKIISELQKYNTINSLKKSEREKYNIDEQYIRELKEMFPQYNEIILILYFIKYKTFDLTLSKLMDNKILVDMEALSLNKSNKVKITLANKPYYRGNQEVHVTPKFKNTSIAIDINNTEELKSEIDRLKDQRSEAYMKAAKAFKLHNKLGKYGVASYYSSQAHELHRRISATCYESTKVIISKDGYKLDLHDFTVSESTPIITGALDEWYGRELVRLKANHISRLPPFEFITGTGLHSKDDKKWYYKVQQGSVLVHGPLQ